MLKDAAAARIYGSQAAGGDRGNDQTRQVDLHTSTIRETVSIQTRPVRSANLMNSRENWPGSRNYGTNLQLPVMRIIFRMAKLLSGCGYQGMIRSGYGKYKGIERTQSRMPGLRNWAAIRQTGSRNCSGRQFPQATISPFREAIPKWPIISQWDMVTIWGALC